MIRNTRRQFLAGATGAVFAGFSRHGARPAYSATNDKISVAVIGFNGMGMHHVRRAAQISGSQVVALCDVDDAVLARGVSTVKDVAGNIPRTTRDFRSIIDDKSIENNKNIKFA